MNNQIRPDLSILWQACFFVIVPDGENTELLRPENVPVQVVADHPCFRWRYIQFIQRKLEDPDVGFAVADFGVDKDSFKIRFKIKTLYLFPLHVIGAVRDDGKADV